jgi:hypothetical protein
MPWRRLAGIAGNAALAALSAVMIGEAVAQTAMPAGIVRGGFVSSTGSAASGELVIRGSGNALYGCSYDARTYVERAGERIPVTLISGGELIEILADRKYGSGSCYARMVQVVNRHPLRPVGLITARPLDSFAPRGDIAFGGMIVGCADGVLTIRTRAGRVRLSLRRDTRFLRDGLRLDPDQAPVNAHVFVRAGRDLAGDLEAFQVIWGTIVNVE